MMTIKLKRAAAEARALNLSLALAARVGWTLDRTGPALSTPCAGYLHVSSAQLLFVPTVAGLDYARRQVEPATRSCRSDALIVSLPDAVPRFAFAAWAPMCTSWISPLGLWLGDTGELWLVPADDEGDRLGVHLVDALHALGPAPWAGAAQRRAGLARAGAWLTEIG